MYLHLGQDTIVRKQDIVGIFDLDNTTVSAASRKTLAAAEKQGRVVNVSYELPKSFIVCAKKGEKQNKVYISQLSSTTLYKRADGLFESENKMV